MITELSPGLRRALRQVSDGSVEFDVPLARLSHWGIGGRAWAVVEPASAEGIQAIRKLLVDSATPSLVIGSTSNLLFDSAGYDGVLIRIAERMVGVEVDDGDVVTVAGTAVPVLARATADAGLAGLEHTVGIPGTIGGLVVMNGGSQRKHIGASVVELVGIDQTGQRRTVDASTLRLGYRKSGIEALGLAIVEVRLRLSERDEPTAIHGRMDAIVSERAAKFPLDFPSCGSTFLSDPAMYASVGPPGKVIEDAGLKGLVRGGAQISPHHANFIVNRGGASSDDVLWLIRVAQDKVLQRTGYSMSSEARFVSAGGAVLAADIAAQQRWADTSWR